MTPPPPAWTDATIYAAVHVTWLALALFVGLYWHRSRWYRTAVGRWTMAKHVAMLAVVSLAVLGIHAPEWVARPWIRLVAWLLVAAVYVGQDVMLVVEQHLARARRRR